ncbi:MAG: glycosyltransferase family 4 protein [Porphyrobacter sp.]|nr:glycosyltransferase family 4 protein [Porphyrobacter sp.]
MEIAIIVSAVPHYFAGRIKEYSRTGAKTLLVNARSSEMFYSDIRSDDVGDVKFIELIGVKPNRIFRSIMAVLDSHKPDVVVIAGWATVQCFAAILWAKRNQKKLVVMSDSQYSDAARSLHREKLKSRIVRTCDTALVGGRVHRDYIVSLGMPEENVFVGYDTVDNRHFFAGAARARAEGEIERRRLGLPARYLLASARFIPKKNLPRLIQAYAKSIGSTCDAPDLVLLGDGPERRSVEAAILENDVTDRVHLMGFRPYDLLPSFYGLAEGFVHVSTAEQWGLVINEAAAAGLPLVVSAPCGASPELVHEGKNGWVVDPLNVEDMALALSLLIALSPSERARMGEFSRQIVAEWGPERFSEGLSAACKLAYLLPQRRLKPWDELLIRFLSKREIRTVA